MSVYRRLSKDERELVTKYNEFVRSGNQDRTVKHMILGKVSITYSHKKPSELWGRFGGGWNWKLGFQASRTMVIFSLLVAELIFKKLPPEEKGDQKP